MLKTEETKVLELMKFTLEELQNIKMALDEFAILAVTDSTGKIKKINDRFCEVSKYTREELIGQDHRILNSGYHPEGFFKDVWRTIGSGKTWKGEICNRAKDGSIYWVMTAIVPFLNEKGKPYQYISIRTDITAQKNINEMTRIAHHDDLTGMPNRRQLMIDLNELIDSEGKPFSIILFDVNRFKNINDGLGHHIGDLFLIELASRLQELTNPFVKYYRLSGDEFVGILSNPKALEKVIEDLQAVFKHRFYLNQHEFYASISIGAAHFPQDGNNGEEILRCADMAMYEAKKTNNKFYVLYRNDREFTYDQMLQLETKLHDAIKNQLFELYYQPKVNLQTNSIEGMEALIRWFDKDLGIVPPNRFIPFAEECGLIGEISEWVIAEAGRQAKQWNERYHLNLRVAVNISPIHLSEENFIEQLTEILQQQQIDPNTLEIELTEMSLIDLDVDLLDKIEKLKNMGIMLSIDDFGTGYSSLSYLKKFPVDALKIDRSFIHQMNENSSDVAMVSAIIALARALNLQVVAEGVEEYEDLQLLREFGCEYVQGYYYSHPLTVSDFTKRLNDQGNKIKH
jgi:diguanylate cyclase (GGDEF)-like protein/PAS domain S-box-containing protein